MGAMETERKRELSGGGGNRVGERGGKGRKVRETTMEGERKEWSAQIPLFHHSSFFIIELSSQCGAQRQAALPPRALSSSLRLYIPLFPLFHFFLTFPLSHYFSPLYFLLVLLCVHLLILIYLLLLHFPLSCQFLHTSSLLCSPFITYIAFSFLSTDAFYAHPLLSLSLFFFFFPSRCNPSQFSPSSLYVNFA